MTDHFPKVEDCREEQTTAKQRRSRKGNHLRSSCHQISSFGQNPKQPPPPKFLGPLPASWSLCPCLFHNSAVSSFSWTNTVLCVCVCHLTINWITLLVPDRSNFYTALPSHSRYSIHLRVAASANSVGSSKQPERATKKQLRHQKSTWSGNPITKQLCGHAKPTHVQTKPPPSGELLPSHFLLGLPDTNSKALCGWVAIWINPAEK